MDLGRDSAKNVARIITFFTFNHVFGKFGKSRIITDNHGITFFLDSSARFLARFWTILSFIIHNFIFHTFCLHNAATCTYVIVACNKCGTKILCMLCAVFCVCLSLECLLPTRTPTQLLAGPYGVKRGRGQGLGGSSQERSTAFFGGVLGITFLLADF